MGINIHFRAVCTFCAGSSASVLREVILVVCVRTPFVLALDIIVVPGLSPVTSSSGNGAGNVRMKHTVTSISGLFRMTLLALAQNTAIHENSAPM